MNPVSPQIIMLGSLTLCSDDLLFVLLSRSKVQTYLRTIDKLMQQRLTGNCLLQRLSSKLAWKLPSLPICF